MRMAASVLVLLAIVFLPIEPGLAHRGAAEIAGNEARSAAAPTGAHLAQGQTRQQPRVQQAPAAATKPPAPKTDNAASSMRLDDPNEEACFLHDGRRRIEACAQAIASKKLRGPRLALVHYMKFLQHMQLGEPDQARKDLDAADAAAPQLKYGERGRLLMGLTQARFDAEIAKVDARIASGRPNASEYRTRAHLNFAAGRLDAARADLTKAIELEPRNAQNYIQRSEIALRRRDHAQAIADLDKAVELDPRSYPALSVRGLARAAVARSAFEMVRAHDDIEKAIALQTDPKLIVELRLWRGLEWSNYSESGNAGVDDFREVLRLDPTNAEARAALAARVGLSTTDPVSDQCASSIDDKQRFAACTSIIDGGKLGRPDLAAAYFQRGRTRPIDSASEKTKLDSHKAALADLNKALELAGENANIRVVHALFSEAVGDDDSARKDYDAIVRLKPNLAWALLKRSRFLIQIGLKDAALADLKEADRIQPGIPTVATDMADFEKTFATWRISNVFECTTATTATPPELTAAYCTRAIDTARRAPASSGPPAVSDRMLMLRAIAFARIKQPQRAVADLTELLTRDPKKHRRVEAARYQSDIDAGLRRRRLRPRGLDRVDPGTFGRL